MYGSGVRINGRIIIMVRQVMEVYGTVVAPRIAFIVAAAGSTLPGFAGLRIATGLRPVMRTSSWAFGCLLYQFILEQKRRMRRKCGVRASSGVAEQACGPEASTEQSFSQGRV